MKSTNYFREKTTRTLLGVLVVGSMAIGLAACDSGGATPIATVAAGTSLPAAAAPTSDTSGASGNAQTVRVGLKEWAVDLPNKELTAGKYTFDVANDGQFSHDLVIESNGGEVGRTPSFKKASGDKTLEVDLKPGTYKFVCDLPGHAEKGMVTEVTVK